MDRLIDELKSHLKSPETRFGRGALQEEISRLEFYQEDDERPGRAADA